MSRATVGRATAWSAIDQFGRQAATFVVSVILARLITPAAFGAIAIMMFFTLLVTTVIQQSLGMAVIQRQQSCDEEVSSIFWWNLILSVVASLALIAAGQPIAVFLHLPVLEPLMLAAAAYVILGALGTVHYARLTREMRFDLLAKAGLFSTILSGLIGIILALNGAGVWALAAQLVSAAALGSAAIWIISPWRPGLTLQGEGLREALGFARWLGLSGVLEVLSSQGFSVLLGKFYGARDVGLYGRGVSTQQLPSNVLTAILSRVALPVFSARQNDTEALRRCLVRVNRMAMLINLPTLVGLGLTADLVIEVLFGPQWVEAGPVLAILAWAGVLYPITVNNQLVLLASGRSKLYLGVQAAKGLLGILAIIIGSLFGITELALSQVLVAILVLLTSVAVSGRVLQFGLGNQLKDLAGLFTAALLMGVAVVAMRFAVDLGVQLELALSVGIGVVSFVGAGFLLRITAFHEALETGRDAFRALGARGLARWG